MEASLNWNKESQTLTVTTAYRGQEAFQYASELVRLGALSQGDFATMFGLA